MEKRKEKGNLLYWRERHQRTFNVFSIVVQQKEEQNSVDLWLLTHM